MSILVNTSFNLSWEPIVLTPKEAYRTFMQSEMDVLVLEDCVLHKTEQPMGLQIVDRRPKVPRSSQPVGRSRNRRSAYCHGDVRPQSRQRQVLSGGGGHSAAFVRRSTDATRDVTELVKRFYEKTPFPNYDDLDNQRSLLEKARAGVFARLLNEQIPFDARVVEIGCGTGQLTNFLSIAHRSVLGVDACLNSLRLAQKFKSDHGLDRATFAQMNLLRPALKDGFFDVVISNGVLHHTADCRAAYLRISRLAKPGGYVSRTLQLL